MAMPYMSEMQNRFWVIVTQRNTVAYIRRCLDSVLSQDYEGFGVIVVDDNSTDGTWEAVLDYPVIGIHHDKQIYSNTVNVKEALAVVDCRDNDVIVLASGDDYFPDKGVLSYLNDVYADDVYFTYGQFVPESGNYGPYCKPIADTRKYRHCGEWSVSHLLTFRKFLWDKIRDEDLRRDNGEYCKYAFDASIIYPMVEMCGAKHMRFIERIMYVYNDLNPECIYLVSPAASLAEADYYRNKQPYEELP